MANVMDRFWAGPPVTRTLVSAMFIQSVLVYSGLIPFKWIPFVPSLVFQLWIPQLWRLVTPFLLTGHGIMLVIDLYFTWMYGTGLERESARFPQPGDFFVYIVFCATIILLIAGLLMGAAFFTSSLLLALIYTFAQDNRGTKAHFIIIQIPVELLPWAMLTLTLVMSGPEGALIEGSGLLAAHLYDFLTRLYPTFQGGRNIIQTPRFIRRLFGGEAGSGSYTTKSYGTAFRPARPAPAPSTRAGSSSQPSAGRSWTSAFTSSSSSSSSSSWRGRGQGRRLGGD